MLVLLAGLTVVLLGPALPARAHAQLVDTSPAHGTVLDQPPPRIELHFNEPVSVVSLRLRASDAEIPGTTSSDGSTVAFAPGEVIPDGTAVFEWQVMSADGHPIGGSVVFHVRLATGGQVVDQETPVNAGLIVSNALMYVGLVLGGGLALFAVHVNREDREGARLRRITVALLGAGVVGTGATLAMRATGGIFDFTTMPAGAAVAMTAVVLGSALAIAGKSRPIPVTVGVAIALLGPVLTGHTRSFDPRWLLMGSDAVHLYAASVWGGGLAGIALVTRRYRAEMGPLVSRFSRIAAWSLAAVLISGSTLAWTLHGSRASLTGTDHGRLALLKLAIVLAVAGVGAFNRYRLVPALAAAGAKAGRMLANTAAIEAAGLVLVLVVASALVDKDPAGAAGVPAEVQGPVQTLIGDLLLTLEVDPGARGVNEATVRIRSRDGQPPTVIEPVTIVVVADGDRTSYDAVSTSAGYLATIDIPGSGDWGIEVRARIDAFTEAVASLVLDTSTTRLAPVAGLVVAGAVMPAPPGGAGTAAVYMSVTSAKDDRLISAQSPACAEVTLHETVIGSDGTASMEPRPAIDLVAGEPLNLESGGLHVMCQTPGVEIGDSVPFSIVTESGERLDFLVPVVSLADTLD